MVFADLKNDFVFRRIFATHPDLLRRLLNDLLERTGDQAIEALEYLPSEQVPLVEGGKLSILDVRCRDRAGTTFVVEMQLIHHRGFVNRVVYNACKSYSGQLKSGEWYTKLMDVVAVSICDFELWPDAQQKKLGLPPVPMLSRWNHVERSSKTEGLLQIQYAFLELPKLPEQRPETDGVNLWAWLFVHAHELTEIPEDLSPGPYRQALELANQAKFTQEELNTYERVRDEIRQVLEIAAERWALGKTEGRAEGKTEGRAEGKAEGLAEGEAKGKAEGLAEGEAKGKAEAKRDTLLRLLARAGIALAEDDRTRIQVCADMATLDRWIDNVFGAKTAAEVLS